MNDLNHSIKFSLSILKLGRANMINQFTNFEHELYMSIIDSSKGREMEKLNIEKIKLIWLNFHWVSLKLIQENEKMSINEKKEVTIFFATFFKKLLSQFIDGNSIENTELFIKLINNKLNLIKQLIEFGIKHTSCKNQLLLHYEIEKLKYNNLINKLQKNNGEHI